MVTVLVIEDDGVLRSLLVETLADAGYDVIEAVDGVDGVLMAQIHRPSLVLMDVMMSRLSGLDASRTLKSDPTTAAIPIVAMTTSVILQRGVTHHVDGILLKPFELEELFETVARLTATTRQPGEPKYLTPANSITQSRSG